MVVNSILFKLLRLLSSKLEDIANLVEYVFQNGAHELEEFRYFGIAPLYYFTILLCCYENLILLGEIIQYWIYINKNILLEWPTLQ